MPPLERFLALKKQLTELLAHADLPPPDRVEYGRDSVYLFWDGPRLAVCVDLEPDDAA
jgi:hypothetical protein